MKMQYVMDCNSHIVTILSGKENKKWKKWKKYLTIATCYAIISFASYGEVSEWFKELVLKTSDPARDQGFESLPLRHFFIFL